MFDQLKKMLTRINLAVMTALCLLLVSGTYLVMSSVIFNQSQQLLQIIADQAGAPGQSQDLHHDKHVTHYFYLKIDAAGNILEESKDLTLDATQISSVVNIALLRPSPRGRVEIAEEPYNYLKVTQDENNEQLLVFVSVERDKETLGFLLLTLSAVGIIYLVLAYFGGRFLAGKALQPIMASWQRQKDFVADASHELRTPLAVIQTNLELVKGNPEETVAEQMKWLDYIDLETKRLSKLVNDLLFLARADSKQQVLDMKEFSLSVAIENTVAPFQPLAEQLGIMLECSVPKEIYMQGDENKIKQLVIILLDNALKHSKAGDIVNVKVQNLEYCGQIIVADTGEGIASEHLPNIFERFYRADKARSKQTGGTGLGLSIAQWIVQRHDGLISVTSQIGQSTVFTVTLPKAPPKKRRKDLRNS